MITPTISVRAAATEKEYSEYDAAYFVPDGVEGIYKVEMHYRDTLIGQMIVPQHLVGATLQNLFHVFDKLELSINMAWDAWTEKQSEGLREHAEDLNNEARGDFKSSDE